MVKTEVPPPQSRLVLLTTQMFQFGFAHGFTGVASASTPVNSNKDTKNTLKDALEDALEVGKAMLVA